MYWCSLSDVPAILDYCLNCRDWTNLPTPLRKICHFRCKSKTFQNAMNRIHLKDLYELSVANLDKYSNILYFYCTPLRHPTFSFACAVSYFSTTVYFLSFINTHLTTSTAPARTLGSLPIMETLAAKDPSMLNTTHSIPRGSTVRKASAFVWSPLKVNAKQ